jgi:hypothetical protein
MTLTITTILSPDSKRLILDALDGGTLDPHDELSETEKDTIRGLCATTYLARFVPQAWVRDQAIDVDPEGDTEWDVTEAFLALPDDYREVLLQFMENDRFSDGEALDRHDALKEDPNAPEWIREFRGPFSLYVRCA